MPTTVGTSSLENASSDPLAAYNVIYNLGAAWPTTASIATTNGATETGSTVTITMSATNDLAVADSVTIAGVSVAGYNGTFTVTKVDSTTQFEYTDAVTGLANSGRGTVADTAMNPVAQSRLNAFFTRKGRLHRRQRVDERLHLPIGGKPHLRDPHAGQPERLRRHRPVGQRRWLGERDQRRLPRARTRCTCRQNTTYFTSVPTGAVTDGQYLATFATVGSANGYVAGLWNNRQAAANSAPVLVHGATSTGSRYVGYATNPFSRYDDSRDWPLVVQAALWSDLTDEGTVSYATASTAAPNGSISPSGDVQLAVGSSETYTITPDSGYVIADVTVDGQSVGNASSYTFENVGAAHAIRATFSDVRGPDVSAAGVPLGWASGPVGLTFTADDNSGSGVAYIQYAVGSGAWTQGTAVTIGAQGTTTVAYRAVDNTGNVGDTHIATVRIDTTNPTVTADAPSTWSSNAVTVHLTAADTGGSALQATQYRLQGSNVWLDATGNQFVVPAADGVHIYEFRALDTAGNASATGTATVRIDTTAPIVSSDAPSAWSNAPVTVHLTAADTGGSALQATQYRLQGSSVWLAATGNQFVVPATDGVYDYEFRAVDNAGNASATGTATVRIDTTAPIVSSDAPSTWGAAAVTVHLTAADTGGSALQATQYRLQGSSVWLAATGNQFVVPAADGVHVYEFRALDNAGNASATGTATVRIDTTGPTTFAKNITVKAGRKAILSYKGTDALSPQLTAVTILVANAKGKIVHRISLGTRTAGAWHSVSWSTSGVAKGTYHYAVFAKDLAGNPQTILGAAKVVVK